MRVMTIGPFIYGQTAEDSKRVYRLKNVSYKKKKKYPFNFEGKWTSEQSNDMLTLDFKKAFKTKLTYTFTDKDSEFFSVTENLNVVHPYVLTFSMNNRFKYYCLFLSGDMKSAVLKIYDIDNVLIGEYSLKKE